MPVSQPQATPVSQDELLRAACADALNELLAARKLLKSQGVMIEKQDELIGLENQLSTGLKNLRSLDAAEKDQLRKAIAAAERQVAAVEAQVAILKKNQVTFWKKAKWIIYGAAAGIIAGAVLK